MEVSVDQSLPDAERRDCNRKEVNSQFKFFGGTKARAICLGLIPLAVIVYFLPRTAAQTNQGTVIPASRPGLSPVQLPDMQSMEPDVREHLIWAQNSLLAAVKDSAIPLDKLG